MGDACMFDYHNYEAAGSQGKGEGRCHHGPVQLSRRAPCCKGAVFVVKTKGYIPPLVGCSLSFHCRQVPKPTWVSSGLPSPGELQLQWCLWLPSPSGSCVSVMEKLFLFPQEEPWVKREAKGVTSALPRPVDPSRTSAITAILGRSWPD